MSTVLTRRISRAVFSTARVFATILVLMILAGVPRVTLAAPAAAAEPTALTNVLLSIYPEYDDPRLLMMLDGYLPRGASIPATVRFLVPTGAEMNSAGSLDAQGKYKGGPPNRKASGIAGWDEISYDVTTNHFRMEYYHDSIQGLPEKNIAFEFRSVYPIDSLQVDILQPAKATNFNPTPPAQSKATIENMAVHRYRYTNIEVEKPLAFNISYTKADSVPSVKPQAGSGASTGSGPNLLLILGLVGVVAVGGAIWYGSKRRRYRYASRNRGAKLAHRTSPSTRSAPSRTPASRATSASSGRSPSAEGRSPSAEGRSRTGQQVDRVPSGRAGFCRKCGAQMGANARFCPKCGAQNG